MLNYGSEIWKSQDFLGKKKVLKIWDFCDEFDCTAYYKLWLILHSVYRMKMQNEIYYHIVMSKCT